MLPMAVFRFRTVVGRRGTSTEYVTAYFTEGSAFRLMSSAPRTAKAI